MTNQFKNSTKWQFLTFVRTPIAIKNLSCNQIEKLPNLFNNLNFETKLSHSINQNFKDIQNENFPRIFHKFLKILITHTKFPDTRSFQKLFFIQIFIDFRMEITGIKKNYLNIYLFVCQIYQITVHYVLFIVFFPV